MIARVILLLVAWFGFQAAIEGFEINAKFSSAPAELSLIKLEELGANAPPFVRVSDFVRAEGVCVTTNVSDGNGPPVVTRILYVPLIPSAQAGTILPGKPTPIATFAEYQGCGNPPEESAIRGVVKQGKDTFIPRLRGEFLAHGILAPKQPIIIARGEEPWSVLSNLLLLLLSLSAAIAALVPFFFKHKWPTEADVEKLDDEAVFRAVFPIMKVFDERSTGPREELLLASEAAEEVILVRINCIDSFKRPAVAAFTNRRYILYRTPASRMLRFLTLLERLIGGLPFIGGFLSMLVTPFAETYEILGAPRHKAYREAMGYSDAEVLAGPKSWKQRSALTWSEVAARGKSLAVKRAFWSGNVKLEFSPRTLTGLFRTPPDIQIEQMVARAALGRVTTIFGEKLLAYGCTVARKDPDFEIDFEPVHIAEK